MWCNLVYNLSYTVHGLSILANIYEHVVLNHTPHQMFHQHCKMTKDCKASQTHQKITNTMKCPGHNEILGSCVYRNGRRAVLRRSDGIVIRPQYCIVWIWVPRGTVRNREIVHRIYRLCLSVTAVFTVGYNTKIYTQSQTSGHELWSCEPQLTYLCMYLDNFVDTSTACSFVRNFFQLSSPP